MYKDRSVAKNKGKFGKAKPDIEEQDEFVSGVQHITEKLKPYAKQLLIGGTLVLIAVVAAIGYNMYRNKKAAAASELYGKALQLYDEPVMSEEEATLIKSLNLPNQQDFVTHPSVKARAEMALEILDELQSKYASTEAAQTVRLFHAGVLFDAERFDEAADMYSDYAGSDAPAEQRAVAREGQAYALEAKALAAKDDAARKAGLEAALAVFKQVQPDVDGVLRDRSLYHQARVLQSLDRRDEAVALYNEVLDTIPTTALRRDINDRLATLDAPTDASN